MMRLSLLLPLAALAACNAPSEPANESAPVANVAEPVVTNDVAPDTAANTAMPPFAEVPGAHPTAPEPAPIPAKFRGTWADSKAACADLKHHSRLGVSGRTLATRPAPCQSIRCACLVGSRRWRLERLRRAPPAARR